MCNKITSTPVLPVEAMWMLRNGELLHDQLHYLTDARQGLLEGHSRQSDIPPQAF